MKGKRFKRKAISGLFFIKKIPATAANNDTKGKLPKNPANIYAPISPLAAGSFKIMPEINRHG